MRNHLEIVTSDANQINADVAKATEMIRGKAGTIVSASSTSCSVHTPDRGLIVVVTTTIHYTTAA